MKKRYKLILILLISFILVFIIYYKFNKNEIIYVAIGDNLNNNLSTYNYVQYINYYYPKFNTYNFTESKLHVEDVLYYFETNNKLNYLVKNAKIVTLSLGTFELYNYKTLNGEIVNDYLYKVKLLIDMLSQLNSNIYFINIYDKNLKELNDKIKMYCNLKKIKYLDYLIIGFQNIYNIDTLSYLNYEGHKNIAKTIVKQLY